MSKKADVSALADVKKTADFNAKDIANLKISVKDHAAAIATIDYSGKADKSYVDAELGKKADASKLTQVSDAAKTNAEAIGGAIDRISATETAISDLTLSRSALFSDLATATGCISANATAILTLEADVSYSFRQQSKKISANEVAIADLAAAFDVVIEDYEDRFSSLNYTGKADTSYVDEELAKKADAADVEDAFALKADKTALAELTEAISQYVIEFTESMSEKADTTYVNEELAKKAKAADVEEIGRASSREKV